MNNDDTNTNSDDTTGNHDDLTPAAPKPEDSPIPLELHRLPLWQTTLASMRKEGIRYGQTYSMEYFELRLGANRDSAEFGFAVGLIRRELEHSGFYLTARGQSGNGFAIAEVETIADIMLRYEREGIDKLCRAVILGSNADLRTLTEAQRRRHDAVLARVAQRAALISRKMPRALSGDEFELAAPTA